MFEQYHRGAGTMLGSDIRLPHITMRPRCRRPAGGFTLVELLVVIGIIAVLVAVLLPALASARAQSDRTVCLSNLRQISLAAQVYAQQYNSYPPAWANYPPPFVASSSTSCLWMDLIEPYIEKSSNVYQCPDDPLKIAVTWDSTIILSYGINTFQFSGNSTCFWYGVNPVVVRRPSEIIIFADCTPGNFYCGWTPFTNPVAGVAYRHAQASFCAVFCDGHAEPETQTTQLNWDASQ